MKPFSERNPVIIGAISVALLLGVIVAALQYDKLPFINPGRTYTAYFSETGGLRDGAAVQVSGFPVGKVTGIDLEDSQVVIEFRIDSGIRLGEQTEASIKTIQLLGAKVLEVSPRGGGVLNAPIPEERTTPPYQIPDVLGELSATVEQLDTGQVNDALATISSTFRDTPPELQVAVDGLGRFSDTLAKRDAQLRTLLTNARKVTGVLAERSDQVVSLVRDTNALLAHLSAEGAALDALSGNLSELAQQLSGFIAENREGLRPAVDKLNGVLTIVDNRKERIQLAVKYLNQYSMSLGESVASGPFFKAMIVNLLPGQFIQPFVDAAFSDLGLDPNTLPPSELSDPQIGQPGTPPLPLPYPRTGQGGEPRLTVPDAITGNPGDQQCGPPGVPLPGPGCYPLRDPGPAPQPGGPPPGPPAPPLYESTLEPTPSPVHVPAPNEVPAVGAPGSGAPPVQEGN